MRGDIIKCRFSKDELENFFSLLRTDIRINEKEKKSNTNSISIINKTEEYINSFPKSNSDKYDIGYTLERDCDFTLPNLVKIITLIEEYIKEPVFRKEENIKYYKDIINKIKNITRNN